MIFVFIEDGTLDVVADIEEARRQYEGVDVESGVFTFYDDRGTYLRPDFVVPNKYGSFLGLIEWSESGIFDLVVDPDADGDPLWLSLYETEAVNPNPWFDSLKEVKDYLQANGAVVDRPRSGL